MYGKDKAIVIESHDEKDADVLLQEQNGDVAVKVSGPSQHGELKRIGVLSKLRHIVDSIRQKTFDASVNKEERYVVVKDTNTFALNERLIHIF